MMARQPRRHAQRFVRNADANELFESFMVAAVATVLSVRGLLAATGYPSIGGHSLHIAHMLWGGLLMVIAIMLLLGYLGPAAKSVASLVGGIGFGLFIDELGKFVTRNNNYFFQPTLALIYAVFVLVFIAAHAAWRGRLSRDEAVANALELTQEAVRHDLDREERRRALVLLERGNADDPVVAALSRALADITALPDTHPGLPSRLRRWSRDGYRRLVDWPWFTRLAIAAFVAHAVYVLGQAAFVAPRLATGRHTGGLPFMDVADLIFSVLPAALVIFGALRLTRSRLAGFEVFRYAVLVEIFITQFFAFYKHQFVALAGLFGNILILAVLRYVIAQERRMIRHPAAP